MSVRLICDTAQVSRSTFYAHFDDKQDLLDLAFETLRGALRAEVRGRGLDRHANLRCLPRLVAHMESHLPLFERNRTGPSGPLLFGRFRSVVGTVIAEEIAGSRLAGEVTERRRDFIVGGVFGVLERWCEAGCPERGETILETLDEHVSMVLGNTDRAYIIPS